MTPAQLSNYCKGKHNFVESSLQTQHELARLISFYSVAPHSKKIKKPEDLFKLRWDNKHIESSKTSVLTNVELQKMNKSFQVKGKKSTVKG